MASRRLVNEPADNGCECSAPSGDLTPATLRAVVRGEGGSKRPVLHGFSDDRVRVSNTTVETLELLVPSWQSCAPKVQQLFGLAGLVDRRWCVWMCYEFFLSPAPLREPDSAVKSRHKQQQAT